MEMNKARNMLEHEKEIYSRPPRTWIQPNTTLKRPAGTYMYMYMYIHHVQYMCIVHVKYEYIIIIRHVTCSPSNT